MLVLAVVVLAFLAPEQVELEGIVCCANRDATRFVVLTGDGARVPVALAADANVTFEGAPLHPEDILPGEKVRVRGTRLRDEPMEAMALDVRVRIVETLANLILGIRPRLLGRFALREAKSEYFSLRLPDGNYIRVDAKSAYGPHGRVWVSTLRSGDLLELSGRWVKDREFKASSIDVLSQRDASYCATRAPRGESKEETAAREAREGEFLAGSGPLVAAADQVDDEHDGEEDESDDEPDENEER